MKNRALLALSGLILGGLLGYGAGSYILNAVAGSLWIRTNGLIFDLITLFVAFAPYIGLCIGAAGGAKLLLRLTNRKPQLQHAGGGHAFSSETPFDPTPINAAYSAAAKRGRIVLLMHFLVVLGASAFVIWRSVTSMQAPFDSYAGRVAVASRAIRFLLTFLLLLMVYRGSVIAKWICIALFGLSCLIFIPAVLESPRIAPLLFIYVSCAAALLVSKDIGEFLEQQRARRR